MMKNTNHAIELSGNKNISCSHGVQVSIKAKE